VVPIRHWGRWAATALVLILAALLAWQVAENSILRWGIVWERLFARSIFVGMGVTILLTASSMALGLAGGIALATMKMSASPLLRSFSGGFIWLFRGTPVMVQILIWFNLGLFLPELNLGFTEVNTTELITPLTAAGLGLAFNESAYMAEIIRGGIIGVDSGQSEACAALGMTKALALRRIILPQALRSIVPPLGNEAVTLLKETSLVAVIGAGDLLTMAQRLGTADFSRMEMYMVASAWYLVLTSILTAGQAVLERRLAKARGLAPRRLGPGTVAKGLVPVRSRDRDRGGDLDRGGERDRGGDRDSGLDRGRDRGGERVSAAGAQSGEEQ
jgi:polar amino acid transport system permease protein